MSPVSEIKNYACPDCKISGGVFYGGQEIKCPNCGQAMTENTFIPDFPMPLPKGCPYPSGYEAGAEEQTRVGLRFMEEKKLLNKKDSLYWEKYMRKPDNRFNPAYMQKREDRLQREEAVND